MLVNKVRPFETNIANLTNVMSQVVHMIRMYVGLFYITGSKLDYLSDGWLLNISFLIIVAVPSLAFMLIWFGKVRAEFLIIIYDIDENQKWFHYLTCGLVD